MSRRNRYQTAAVVVEPEPDEPPRRSDSVPVGTIWLAGMVKTANGFCVAQLELTAEQWAALPGKKELGPSQAFPEHIAKEHKGVAQKLDLRTQLQRVAR